MTVDRLIEIMDGRRLDYRPRKRHRNYAILPHPLRRKAYLEAAGRFAQLRKEFGAKFA